MNKQRKNLFAIILIACFVAVTAFRYLSDDYENTAIAACYFLSYRYGFIGRSFIGTLLEAFPYMSKSFIHKICYLSEILLTLAILFWSYTVLSKTNESEKSYVFAGILIFLAAPFSPLFTFLWYNCGRLDVFLIIIIFIQSALYISRPRGFRIAFIILTALGMLIHTGHTFMYFSFSEVLLLCDAVSDFHNKAGSEEAEIPDSSNKVLRFLPAVLNFLVCCLLFSCFHFTSFVDRSYTAETMVADMQERTDIDLSIITENVDNWYFMDAAEYVQFQKDFKGGKASFLQVPSVLFPFLITLFLLLPVICTLFILWRDAIRSSKSIQKKIIFILCAFSWITLIPEFVMETDMGRYVAAGFMTQVLLLFTLYTAGDTDIKSSFDNFRSSVLKNRLLWIFFIAETVSLGYLQDVTTLTISDRIWSWIR